MARRQLVGDLAGNLRIAQLLDHAPLQHARRRIGPELIVVLAQFLRAGIGRVDQRLIAVEAVRGEHVDDDVAEERRRRDFERLRVAAAGST